MNYSHFEHRNRFSEWCAARAVHRNFTKTSVLIKALENSGVVDFIKAYDGQVLSQAEFDDLHERWCDSILQSWQLSKVDGASYGRAAKLVAVYIKSMIVLQNSPSSLAEVAHPPIDRILLQNISKDRSLSHPRKRYWKLINWTELEKTMYQFIISDFREILKDQPFWVLEKYWSLNDES